MHFHHYALEVNNLEESIAFYKKYFDFKNETSMSFNGEKLVFLTSKDFRLELISIREKRSYDKTAHICFEVNNLHEMMQRLSGCHKIEGPYTLQNGWQTVFYKGPNEEILEFLQVKPN